MVVVANEEDDASYRWEAQGLQAKHCNISTRVCTHNLRMKKNNKLQDASIVWVVDLWKPDGNQPAHNAATPRFKSLIFNTQIINHVASAAK